MYIYNYFYDNFIFLNSLIHSNFTFFYKNIHNFIYLKTLI